MCFKKIKRYFGDLDKKEKIQSREMEKSIELSEDITEAYSQGGKAVGNIFKHKKKK